MKLEVQGLKTGAGGLAAGDSQSKLSYSKDIILMRTEALVRIFVLKYI